MQIESRKLGILFIVILSVLLYNASLGWVGTRIQRDRHENVKMLHMKPGIRGTSMLLSAEDSTPCNNSVQTIIREIYPSMQQIQEYSDLSIGSATSGNIFQLRKSRGYKGNTTLLADLDSQPFPTDDYPRGTKWVVITSIFPPTRLVHTIASLPEWCMVIVGDYKSPIEADYMHAFSDANPQKCMVYLTVEKQLALDYEILHFLPLNSFGRKNIGYIFAIHHGANVIYDTDDDNEIADLDSFRYWSLSSRNEGKGILKWTGSNPYATLGGVEGIWPRGLPLSGIKVGTARTLDQDPGPTQENICIIQSLADQEPDVDAIYRLTSPHYPAYFTMRSRFSGGIVEEDKMAPFNAQATLFFSEAFDTLLLPVTVHGRVSDIWRGYIAQAVNKGKCALGFVSPWVVQVRNSHNYMADFDAEIPLYKQSHAFVEHLLNSSSRSVTDLFIDAFEHGLLQENDVSLSFAWTLDMKRALLSSKKDAGLEALADEQYHTQFRHLIILMGKQEQAAAWISRILSTPDLQYTDIVFGFFDVPTHSNGCPVDTTRVTCVSVKGTTWATGRNLLARTAFSRERDLGIRYAFWTLGDADVQLSCIEAGDCLRQYNSFLSALPGQFMAVGLIQDGLVQANANIVYTQIPAFDAAWNTFRREAIPILLPYIPDQDENTWWSSQAIFWNRIQCLAPWFAISPAFIFYQNIEHNPYPRNSRKLDEERLLGERLMGGLTGYLPKAPIDYPNELRDDRKRPWPWTEHTNPSDMNILDSTFSQCAREYSETFYRWVQEIS